MPKQSEAVQTALEIRAQLKAAEQACLELGAKLSGQLRTFNGNDFIAYGEATTAESEAAKEG